MCATGCAVRDRCRGLVHAASTALARAAPGGQRRAMPQPSPILPPPDGPASVPPPRRAGPALYMLVAVALFALMDTGLKILSPPYPALQVATLRGAAALRSEERRVGKEWVRKFRSRGSP